MSLFRLWYLSIYLVIASPLALSQEPAILHLSHDATVEVLLNGGVSKGSGFFVSSDVVLTCLHVVSIPTTVMPVPPNAVSPQRIDVVLATGERIEAKLVSIPTQADPIPLQFDFAFLKLSRKPSKPVQSLLFASIGELKTLELGDEVVFSGYPLNTPGMVTHKGMISGATPDRSLIFIEASVNKGNSGGALMDKEGNIVGIVSMREGGLSPAMENLRAQLAGSAQSGITITQAGVNPIRATGLLVDTIDEYISVGIGYARNAAFAKNYLEHHPEILK